MIREKKKCLTKKRFEVVNLCEDCVESKKKSKHHTTVKIPNQRKEKGDGDGNISNQKNKKFGKTQFLENYVIHITIGMSFVLLFCLIICGSGFIKCLEQYVFNKEVLASVSSPYTNDRKNKWKFFKIMIQNVHKYLKRYRYY